jgi:hypothetical protein
MSEWELQPMSTKAGEGNVSERKTQVIYQMRYNRNNRKDTGVKTSINGMSNITVPYKPKE